MYENMEMRAVFGQKLSELMESNPNICCLDADLAKANGTIKLRDKFPDRAFDVGIAEQNMASVAAGMASYGFIPFITTFTPFATRRILDQVAISISYAKQNVKIVGSDPGISAELNGGTHMSVEDMGVLRCVPGIVIFEPVDSVQLAAALPSIIEYDGPVYIRMFRKALPVIFGDDYKFDLFKADKMKDGKDVSLFASGIMVKAAQEAAKMLAEEGIDAEIINIHTLKPLDEQSVLESVAKTRCAVVCENHNVMGALFSAVCETICRNDPVPVEAIGIQDHFGEVGKVPFLQEKYRMRPEDIVEAVKKVRGRAGF